MNYNRSDYWFKQISKMLSDTTKVSGIVADMTARRLENIKEAIGHQLQLIPLQVTLNAAGQIQAYNVRSNPLNYDLIVAGYMSDGQNRDIILQKAENDKPLVFVGDASGLYLSFTDISGQPQNVNPKGQKGVFYLPQPTLFRKNERISLDVFKKENTADAEVVNFVVIGYRVIPENITRSVFSNELPEINTWMSKRTVPSTLFLKGNVIFNTADELGQVEFLTPQFEEPCLIIGVRTSLQNASFTAALEGQSPITIDKTPIWAFGHGDEIEFDNYLWQRRAIYVPPHLQMRMKFYNDGQALDPQGLDGENFITFCISTV